MLSIVILQTNKPKDAERCLRSLSHAELPAETEIIVINNGGHDANAQIDPAAYATLPVRMIELPRDGYVYGNNRGYEAATGDVIATINADITVEPDTLTRLMDHLHAHPEAGIVAPRLIYTDGVEQQSARRFPIMRELMAHRLWQTKPRAVEDFGSGDFRRVDWITGALFLLTRRCYETIGGHDERFYLFMSDVALCREAWAHGFAVHQVHDARATHNEQRLSQGNLLRMLLKKTGRAHVKDAWTYFRIYASTPLPSVPSDE